jgi:hypothetical protein
MPFPGFNDLASFTPTQQQQVQQFISYLQAWLRKEHKDGGEHSAITADSIVTTGDATIGGDGTFAGDVIAEFGSGTETGIGGLHTVDGDAFLPGLVVRHGLLFGGVTDGYFLVKQSKGGAFGGGGGTYSWALYDLANSPATAPMLEMALDSSGVYAILDGGTGSTRVQLGNISRRLAGVYADSYSDATGTLGAWHAVTYAAGNFTASAGTWTVDAGDQIEYTYTIDNKRLTLRYDIQTTDVSNAGVTLKIAIPGGFIGAARVQSMVGYASDNGGALVPALVQIASGGTVVTCSATLAGGGFAITAADNTRVFGTLVFEVQ